MFSNAFFILLRSFSTTATQIATQLTVSFRLFRTMYKFLNHSFFLSSKVQDTARKSRLSR